MLHLSDLIIANFRTPEEIGVTAQSMLWLLPLVASIVVVYKATKVPQVKARHFLKETVVLFGSIVIFMLVTALVLLAISWLITE
jgi:type VI protein secretion system component VasK